MNEVTRGITFVIPVYNEQDAIVDTISRLRKALEPVGVPWEVVVVNDGCTDGTRALAVATGGVRIVDHPMNIGYGNAVKTGIRSANYEWVGIVDADGSYPIEKCGLLVEAMKEGYDMAVIVRQNINQIDSLGKRMFRSIFKKAVQWLNDSRIEDPNSGFRVFRRDAVLKLLPLLCGTFSFTTSLTILLCGLCYFVKFIPGDYSPRKGRSKVRTFRDSVRTCEYIVQGIIFFNPMKFFILLAVFVGFTVYLPAVGLAFLGWHTVSLYYVIFGTAAGFMMGIGGLGDVIRISMTRRDHKE